MNCEYLKKLMKSSDNIIVDVRTSYEYQQTHINGAILISLHELPRNINILRNKNVYLYCRTGARSGQAETFLKSQGVNAINIGGLNNYTDCLVR